jgi:hypothetical protein
MKNIIYFILSLCTVLIISCSGNTNPVNNNNYVIDPNVFFTLTFNGRTLTTNGLTSNNLSIIPLLKNQTSARALSFGTTETQLTIIAAGSNVNTLMNNTAQQINCNIQVTKQGISLGTYNGIPTNNNSGFITDLTINSTIYNVNINSSVTVTSIDQNYVTGNISLLLEDGTNLIPASGSFRLHKL